MATVPFLNVGEPHTDLVTGKVTPGLWARFYQDLISLLTVLNKQVNATLGVNRFALAGQPTLGLADAGYVGFVTDYRHLVYWDGAAWQWLDGDQPRRFADFDSDPGTGWQICDGSVVAVLQVGGATLTTVNVTTPNFSGNPAFRKSAGVYDGPATTAPTAPGATSSTPAVSGSTTDESSHTHGPGTLGTGNEDFDQEVQSGAGITVAGKPHKHTAGWTGASAAGSAHHHDAGTLAVSTPAITVDTTGQPRRMQVITYYRR